MNSKLIVTHIVFLVFKEWCDGVCVRYLENSVANFACHASARCKFYDSKNIIITVTMLSSTNNSAVISIMEISNGAKTSTMI